MRKALILLAVIAAFAAGYGYNRWFGGGAAAPAKKAERRILYWHDPMHPAYKSDKPGIAPDCGMKLEPVYADDGAAPEAERKVLHYRDPQDPNYKSDKPGFNPETGAELVPVYAEDASSMPPGAVQVTPEKQQLIGVRYGTVEYTNGAQTIRAVGKIAVDETRVHHIHSRTEGWIERVYADFTGDFVKKGQPMLSIYSPELLASQQEYLLALRAREIMKDTSIGADHDSLVRAARKRLELWLLSDQQIESIEKTQQPVAQVTLYSDVSGYVLARNAFHNQKVTPETELYTVADLSRVWVLANVYEYEAPLVRLGQPATVTLSYMPGKKYRARVTYVQPQVDAATRTLQVRLELDNPGLALKPEMFVDVELAASGGQRLTVPFEAVLDSGLRKVVFVDLGNGWFEPRGVETGRQLGDRIEIVKGLKAGERIVTSGTFLINSESQLKAAASGMGAPAGGHQHGAALQPQSAPAPAGAHQHD
jgi:RND family efflux transporter MFP subunit